MRWVTCFACRSDSGESVDMLKVAVLTAIRNTSMHPTVVLDDPVGGVAFWLRERGVETVPWRSRWADRIDEIKGDHDRQRLCSAFGPGTMLRLEIADIAAAAGWRDDRVLYTDHDVWFRSCPIAHLGDFSPLGACRESRGVPRMFNAGVLAISLPAMRAIWPTMRQWVDDNLASLMSNRAANAGMDQATLNRFFRQTWQPMPQTLNAMPWWGDETYDAGVIVHIHGAKPSHRAMVRDGTLPATMMMSTAGAYLRACEDWERLRDELLGA